MNGIRRALLLSTADRYFALVSNFVTVAVVSRLLSPEEIGVSVVGMAIISLAMAAREFAGANFLIQLRDPNRESVRSAVTVMVALTTVLSLALAAAAPFLALAYADDRLVPYLQVISVSILAEVVAAPIVTLLRREMAFARVAAINMSSATSSAAVTIVLASLGFSYMSFAWAWLASAMIANVLAITLGPELWIFRPSLKQWRRILAFGGYNGATVFLYRIYEALPLLLLGRVLSLDAAAIYSRSLMVCQLPDKLFLSGVTSVALPAFSRQVRQDRDIKQPYLTALSLVTGFQWPALVVLSILAYPVVDILLGSQWHAVAGLVQIIALALLFSFSFELNYPVLVSTGAVRDVFLRAVIVCPVSAGIIAAAAFISLEAVAWSLTLVIPFQALVSLIFIRRHIAISWHDIIAALWRSAATAVASATGPLAVVALSGFRFDLSRGLALTAAGLAGIGWLVGLLLTQHPLSREISPVMDRLRLPRFAKTQLGA